jgi:elongation factor Tu
MLLTAIIPTTGRPKDKPFLMPVEDVFSISGRGTVVTGRVEQGIVKGWRRDRDRRYHARRRKRPSRALRCSASCWIQGEAGDNIGALLRGTKREDVERGQVLCASRARSSRTPKFEAEAYILTKEEGGRHTPFFNGTARSSTSARRT